MTTATTHRLSVARDAAVDDQASSPCSQVAFMHRSPRVEVVDRLKYLVDLARGQDVLHLGFADTGCLGDQLIDDRWLHGRLARSARSLVGVDISPDVVAWATGEGYVAFAADCTDADSIRRLPISSSPLVIAGELIEHLDSPGRFLDAAHHLVAPGGSFVLTTPNASSLFSFAAAVGGYEAMHPDHVAIYSWHTLTTLLNRHGWDVRRVSSYTMPGIRRRDGRTFSRRLLASGGKLFVRMERIVATHVRPLLASGLIVVCSARDVSS